MKILVLTANFGGNYFAGWAAQDSEHVIDYIKYDDQNFPARHLALHTRLKGKIPKMLAWELHPGYDYYIWMDSRCEISTPHSIDWLIDQCGDKDMALFPHPYRGSVKEELDYMEVLMQQGDQYLLGRYSGENMQGQYEEYLRDPIYTDDKLFACTLFIYRGRIAGNRENNILKEWFYHNCLYSVQDQVSFPYLLQKYNINYNTVQANIFDCPQFRYR